MKAIEREKVLMERLTRQRKLDLDEAVGLLEVSESTVRRIFSKLEESGKAIRTHGGLTLISDNLAEYSFETLINSRHAEKMAIGACAAREIRSGDILYIDCGTTVLALCISLVTLIRENAISDIQIFTNSLANLEALSPTLRVNLIGGRYRPNRKDFAGYLSEMTLRELHFTKCFLGTDGITASNHFCATDFDTAALNQIVTQNADKVYVLCDSTKFGKASLVSYADASSVNVVITDGAANRTVKESFKAQDVEVITA